MSIRLKSLAVASSFVLAFACTSAGIYFGFSSGVTAWNTATFLVGISAFGAMALLLHRWQLSDDEVMSGLMFLSAIGSTVVLLVSYLNIGVPRENYLSAMTLLTLLTLATWLGAGFANMAITKRN